MCILIWAFFKEALEHRGGLAPLYIRWRLDTARSLLMFVLMRLCRIRLFQILEPRFTSDTLAMLLNIPPQKTLLRRHLATNYSALVGAQAQQEKREYANATGHTPLTTTAKVRVRCFFIFRNGRC